MELIETRKINSVSVNGYYGDNQAWFTRTQIGQALGYNYPVKAIGVIHSRHKDRFEGCSRVLQIEVPSGKQEGWVYNTKGMLEICRWSRQPKADAVMDALFDMAETVMKKGYFSTMSDGELVQYLIDRAKQDPNSLNCIDKRVLKARAAQEIRAAKDHEYMLLLLDNSLTRREILQRIAKIYGDDWVGSNWALKDFHRQVKERA